METYSPIKQELWCRRKPNRAPRHGESGLNAGAMVRYGDAGGGRQDGHLAVFDEDWELQPMYFPLHLHYLTKQQSPSHLVTEPGGRHVTYGF